MHDHKWDEVPTMWFAATCWVGAVTVGALALVERLALLLGIGDTSVRIFVVTLTLVIGLTLGEAAHIRQRGWPGVLAKREETRRA